MNVNHKIFEMMPCYIHLFNWTKLMMETVNKMCLTTFVQFKFLSIHNFVVGKIFDKNTVNV